jgi:hypothetical protein
MLVSDLCRGIPFQAFVQDHMNKFKSFLTHLIDDTAFYTQFLSLLIN